MSTKIYYAWRCDLSRTNEAIAFLRSRIWTNVLKVASKANPEGDVYTAAKKFVEALGDAGLHVFLDQEKGYRPRAYFLAYGSPGFLGSSSRLPRWLSEYAYWNNTDAPEDISERRWKERGETWDRVAFEKNANRWIQHRSVVEVFGSGAPYCEMDLADYFRKLQRRRARRKASGPSVSRTRNPI